MNVTTIDSVTYGVSDIDAAKRFWTDFGLKLLEETKGRLLFSSLDESTVEVKLANDPSLPPRIEDVDGVRESIFGVQTQDDVNAIAAELSKDRKVVVDPDGTIHALDPVGIPIGFRVSRCVKVTAPEPQFNMPGRVGRLNGRGRFYDSAKPMEMTHVVYMIPKCEEEVDFYTERLNFRISDCYRGRGYFLRGKASNNHHNLFLLNPGGRGEKFGFHHLAFEMANIHELFGGGLKMTKNGWKTMLGPGRHPISSCYFWYFLNPGGGGAEYDFDSDIVDNDWVPKDFPQTPEVFAEWCLAAGMEESLLYRGVQTGDTIKVK
jgi:catechol 2,3-dioxygenase-like lactoylglutathione lyase family enzyme